MRFTDHHSADGTALADAELRAARGDHVIVLEDADCPPALAALCPWVQVQTVGGDYHVSFAAAADISLRFMSLRDPAACLFYFYSHQLSAEPLSRSWQLLLPGLGLATLEVASARPIERREALRRLGDHAASLSVEDKDRLQVIAADFMGRLLPASLTTAPFNTHGAWLQAFSWGMLSAAGDLGPAVDLLMACGGVHSDAAFLAAASTRNTLQNLASVVREDLGDLEGDELATEVGLIVQAAAPPHQLVVPLASQSAAQARLMELVRWALAVGEDKVVREVRLLRKALPGAALSTKGLAPLVHGASAADAEQLVLEFAAEAKLVDRAVISLQLLRRAARELADDRAALELNKDMPAAERLDMLIERRRSRDLAREVAPSISAVGGGGGGSSSGDGGGGASTSVPAPLHITKPYQQALVNELNNSLFKSIWDDARALLLERSVDGVLDGLQVCLTAEVPPLAEDASAAEQLAHARKVALQRRPRALFFQIVWGKLTSVPLMKELDDLVRARQHTPRLLGRAVAETVSASGDVPPGTKLAELTLGALDEALRPAGKSTDWGKINLEELLLRPLARAQGMSYVAHGGKAYTDELVLLRLKSPGAAVFALLGAPDDDTDSFAAVVGECVTLLRRTTSYNEVVSRRAKRLTHKYVVGTMTEWGEAFDAARSSQDAETTLLPRAYVQPLSQAAANFRAGTARLQKQIDEAENKRADSSDEETDGAADSGGGNRDAETSVGKGGDGGGREKDNAVRPVRFLPSGKMRVVASGLQYDFNKAKLDHASSGVNVKYAMALAAGFSPEAARKAAGNVPGTKYERLPALKLAQYRLTAGGKATPKPGRPASSTKKEMEAATARKAAAEAEAAAEAAAKEKPSAAKAEAVVKKAAKKAAGLTGGGPRKKPKVTVATPAKA